MLNKKGILFNEVGRNVKERERKGLLVLFTYFIILCGSIGMFFFIFWICTKIFG